VIFALRRPGILLGLVLGFLVGIMLRAAVQRAVARGRRSGGGRGNLRAVGARPGGLRPRAGWAAYLDPYGTVAAVISGVGWGVRPDARRANSDILMLLAALLVHGVLAVAGFAGFVAAGFSWADLAFIEPTAVLHGDLPIDDLAASVSLGFGMVNLGCGLLALVPIPPLELGVVLWSRLPRSAGARRMAYRVLEEQWGVAAVLLLLLLPLVGRQPVLLALIDSIGGAILGAF
jgi:hypothetical protein